MDSLCMQPVFSFPAAFVYLLGPLSLPGLCLLFVDVAGIYLFFTDLGFLFHPTGLMGGLFGASHLAYGVYLYFTERKNEA